MAAAGVGSQGQGIRWWWWHGDVMVQDKVKERRGVGFWPHWLLG